MDCAALGSHLVGYHFATVTDAERDAVEAHLLACTACLKTYLALKRAAEERPLERPSPDVRARLRVAVARRGASRPRPVPLLARRIPLYQGLVAAALAAAVSIFAFGRPRAAGPVRVHEGIPQVDTSRPRAESLQIY